MGPLRVLVWGHLQISFVEVQARYPAAAATNDASQPANASSSQADAGAAGTGTRLKVVVNVWIVGIVETVARRLTEGAKDHGDEAMAATFWTSAPRRAACAVQLR
ncbi:MAG: hypothetical protein ACYCU0_08380 [Solirubrobacteraceae bacterium]